MQFLKSECDPWSDQEHRPWLQDQTDASISLYACETWTITADIERRIQAMEMKCFRKLLGISYTDHITNKEAKTRTENATGPFEDLLTSVKRTGTSHDHLEWPRQSYKEQYKEGDEEADRKK